jgi:hypothetical protein
VDQAGNVDPTPVEATWEVDARVPDTEITSGPFEGELVGEDVPFTFSTTLGDATFECSLDAAPFSPCADRWTLERLPTAAHLLAVRSVSRAGVVDPTPATRGFITDPDAHATRKLRVNGPNCACGQAGPGWPWWILLGVGRWVGRRRAAVRSATS